jgi:uncharacterized protein involved in exopolysaccharide biosynthesis
MEQNSRELSIANVLKLCLQHKKFLSLLILGAMVFAVILSYFVPYTYESNATLMPPEDSKAGAGLSSLLESVSGGISIGGVGSNNKVQLFTEILKSKEVAYYIIDSAKLYDYSFFQGMPREDLYEMIDQSLDVKYKRSGIIEIFTAASTGYFSSESAKDTAAELSAIIANTAIEGLSSITHRKSVSKAKRKRIFIERMLAENKLKLDSVDAELEKFQEENKVIAIDEQTNAILGNVTNVGIELSKAEAEYLSILQDFNPETQYAKSAEQLLEGLREQYARVQQGGLAPTDKFSIPLEDIPALVRVYTNLVRDQLIMNKVILYLETQKYQEAIQEESDIPSVEVLDKAEKPVRRSSPSKKIMVIFAFLLSGIFGAGYLVAKALYKGNIYLKTNEA